MAAYNKFEGFVGYLGLAGVNCNTDTFRCFLTNGAPSASLDDVLADLTDLSTGGGYTAGGEDIQNTYSETSGTGTCTATDIVWTGSGGGFGPFRYPVAYDDTHASNILIAWWDYGSSISILASETFTVDFAGNVLFTIV